MMKIRGALSTVCLISDLGVLAGAFFEFIGNIVRFIITWVADMSNGFSPSP